MKKFLILLLALVGCYAIVASVQWIRFARLEARLRGGDAKSTATVASEILNSKSERGIRILERYAKEQANCAFEPTRGLFLIGDMTSGDIHIARREQKGLYSSVSVGQPPLIFDRIDLLKCEAEQVDFLLTQKGNEVSFRYRFNYDGEKLWGSGWHY